MNYILIIVIYMNYLHLKKKIYIYIYILIINILTTIVGKRSSKKASTTVCKVSSSQFSNGSFKPNLSMNLPTNLAFVP